MGGVGGVGGAVGECECVLSDPTLAEYEQLGHRAEAWQIVQNGLVISLADPATLLGREEALNLIRAQQTQLADGAWSENYKRTHGVGVLS